MQRAVYTCSLLIDKPFSIIFKYGVRTASLTSEKQGGIKARSPSALLSFKGHAAEHITLKWSIEDTDKSEKEAKRQSNVSFCRNKTKTDLKPLRSSVENQQNFLACVF